MSQQISIIVLTLLCFESVYSNFIPIGFRNFELEQKVKDSYHDGIDAKVEDYQTLWFEQPLDHNGMGVTKKWKQKYLFNKVNVNGTSDKCVLYIGGEAPLGYSTGMTYEWAKMIGAYYVLLEHRFYGQSQPTKDWSVENLRYLSITQALQDTANFIQNVKLPTNNGEKCKKWLLVGGSYAGTMVAWFGLKYPHLITAGIAASPPFFAKPDFPEYNEVIETVLEAYSTPGNNSCVNIVRDSLAEISSMSNTEKGREELEKKLNLCKPLESMNQPDDFYYILTGLYDIFAATVQYNRDADSSYSVRSVCSTLESANGTALEKLIELNGGRSGKCQDTSYEKYLSSFSDTKSNSQGMIRQWYYQTCTEFGWYQSQRKYQPTEFIQKMCTEAYDKNFTMAYTQAMTDSINVQYGGFMENYEYENILVVNGLFDPWHAMSFKVQQNRTDHIKIRGASHCTIMSKPLANEIVPEDMPEAQNRVKYFISNKML